VNSIVRHLRQLLLGMWLGAALFFGAAVAPALFNVLRGAGLNNANELAGSIVTRLLAVLNRGGFEIGLFLLVTAFFVGRRRARWARWAEVISLSIMAIMTAVNHWFISARMVMLRAAMGGVIDQVSPFDPRRVLFDSLHKYSVIAMGVAMIAALCAFVMMVQSDRPIRQDQKYKE
jgi:hypothetical protein